MIAGNVEHEKSEAAATESSEGAGQRVHLKRHLMAAGTALLASLVLFLLYLLRLLPLSIVVEGTTIIVGLIVALQAVFRSGLNQRFSDPSLTAPRVALAILVLMYLMYQSEAARYPLTLFYPVAMLFGVFRLNTTQLLGLAAMALIAHASMLGLWHIHHPEADTTGSIAQLLILAIVLPWFAVMGGYVSRLRQSLVETNRRLEHIAVRDSLTQLNNRRFLMDALKREMARAERLGTTFSICLIDLDHFKAINDTFGHVAGDAILKHFAGIASAKLRATDILGRYGGEEFLLILTDTDSIGASAVAERIRVSTADACCPQIRPDRRISVTIGVASWSAGDDLRELVKRADDALYRGKEAGRSRVVLSRSLRRSPGNIAAGSR